MHPKLPKRNARFGSNQPLGSTWFSSTKHGLRLLLGLSLAPLSWPWLGPAGVLWARLILEVARHSPAPQMNIP